MCVFGGVTPPLEKITNHLLSIALPEVKTLQVTFETKSLQYSIKHISGGDSVSVNRERQYMENTISSRQMRALEEKIIRLGITFISSDDVVTSWSIAIILKVKITLVLNKCLFSPGNLGIPPLTQL